MDQLTSMVTLFTLCLHMDGTINTDEMSEMATCLTEYNGVPPEVVGEAIEQSAQSINALDTPDKISALLKECCSNLAGLSDEIKGAIVVDLMRISVADGEMHDNEAGLIAIVATRFGVEVKAD